MTPAGPADPISVAFAPLLDRPAWGGMKGQGSMFSFEFGDPHLLIREPYVSTSDSPMVRRNAARRLVRPRGEWFLMIEDCAWRIASSEGDIADSDATAAVIESAIRELDGQRLIGVEVDPGAGISCFRFDLGGRLATESVPGENHEQWSLHQPDGMVLNLGADGRVGLVRTNQPHEEKTWMALPPGLLRCGSCLG